MLDNKTFGHYQVVEELGRGGMGVVYKAWEPSLDRFVAIKVLADNLAHNESLKERFIREAKAMATINHPNVIHIHFIGEEKGLPYFAMEFIQGKSLGELLKSGNVLSLPHARNIIYQACKGLIAAHKNGLIHRDIKPDNLMITNDGLLKVVDFGIALSHKTEEKLTNTGEMVGTPGYVSPEACIGQIIDKRADIFSLGIVFYEILAGKVPFENDSPLGLMLEVVQSEILDIRKVNKNIDKNTSKVLNKMVMKSPDDRYQDCEQIISEIGSIDKNKAITTILTDSILVDLQRVKKNSSNDHTIINSLSKTELSLQNTSPLSKNKALLVLAISTLIISLSLGWYFIQANIKTKPLNNETLSMEKPIQKQLEDIDSQIVPNKEVVNNESAIKQRKITPATIVKPLIQKQAMGKSVRVPIFSAVNQDGSTAYNCIEVFEFKVGRENHKSKELERAAKIPDEILKQIQFITVGEIIRGKYGLNAIEPAKEMCPNNNASLILSGLVTDYKKGNKAARYLVGLGAGKQKFQVDLVLKEKVSNKILAQKRIIDRKLGGLLGGSAEKGQYDFAEKISGFVRASIGVETDLFQKTREQL